MGFMGVMGPKGMGLYIRLWGLGGYGAIYKVMKVMAMGARWP